MTTMTVAQIRKELFNNEKPAKINGVEFTNSEARAVLFEVENQDDILDVVEGEDFFSITVSEQSEAFAVGQVIEAFADLANKILAETEQPEAEQEITPLFSSERVVPSKDLWVGTAPESSLPAVLLQPETVDADAALERANFDRSRFWNMLRHEQPKAQFDMELALYKKWDELLKLGGWWAMRCSQGVFYLVINADEFRCFIVSEAGEKLLSGREYYEAFYFFQAVCSNNNMHLDFRPFKGQIWYEYTRVKPNDFSNSHSVIKPIDAVLSWVNYDSLETPEQVHAYLEITENRGDVQPEFLEVEMPMEMLYSNSKHYFKNPRRAGQRIVVLDCAK